MRSGLYLRSGGPLIAMRELKRHIMSGPAPGGARILYDPISGVAVSDTVLAASEPGSGLAYYFHRPSERPSFNWELTDSCSWRCAHCFQRTVSAVGQDGVDVAAERVDRAIALLRASDAEEVSLTGGEPMLVRNLAHVLAALREALPGIRVRVLASGRRAVDREWTSATVDAAQAIGATVRLPLYASRAPAHDAITRTRGSFSDATDLARAFKSAGVRVVIGIGVFEETAADLPNTVELARALAGEDVAVSSVVYPRKGSSRLRSPEGPQPVSAGQLMKLLAWPTTAALATQYVSFEPYCESGCRYPTIDCDGALHGCDIIESRCGRQDSWHGEKDDLPRACVTCDLGGVCRACRAFAGTSGCESGHRSLVSTAAYVVGRRAASARALGFDFEDARAEESLERFMPGAQARAHHA